MATSFNCGCCDSITTQKRKEKAKNIAEVHEMNERINVINHMAQNNSIWPGFGDNGSLFVQSLSFTGNSLAHVASRLEQMK